MQGVAENNVNKVVLYPHILQVSRHHFQRNVMFWGAWTVVFNVKLEAKSSFETFSAQVWKKSSKLQQICRPRVLFDVTFGVCWACLATLGRVWASLLELVVVFVCDFRQKVWFCRFDASLE